VIYPWHVSRCATRSKALEEIRHRRAPETSDDAHSVPAPCLEVPPGSLPRPESRTNNRRICSFSGRFDVFDLDEVRSHLPFSFVSVRHIPSRHLDWRIPWNSRPLSLRDLRRTGNLLHSQCRVFPQHLDYTIPLHHFTNPSSSIGLPKLCTPSKRFVPGASRLSMQCGALNLSLGPCVLKFKRLPRQWLL